MLEGTKLRGVRITICPSHGWVGGCGAGVRRPCPNLLPCITVRCQHVTCRSHFGSSLDCKGWPFLFRAVFDFLLRQMDPSAEEKNAICDIASLAAWVGLSTTAVGEGLSPRDALFTLLGCTGDMHVRLLGNIPEKDYDELLSKWDINAVPPTPIQLSQGGLLGRTARRLCGTEPTDQQRRQTDEDRRTQTADGAKQTLSSDKPSKIKFSTTLDQLNEDEVEHMPSQESEKAYNHYRKLMGDYPAENAEISEEQLSGLRWLIKENRNPYVDFAIFGLDSLRMRRKMKFSGLSLGSDGDLHKTEIAGPENFATWEESFEVLRTGLLMLGQVDVSTMTAYHNHIKEYNARYGHDIWMVLYQADVRCRHSHFVRLRRKLIDEQWMAIQNGGLHPYDPSRPWNHIFRAAVHD